MSRARSSTSSSSGPAARRRWSVSSSIHPPCGPLPRGWAARLFRERVSAVDWDFFVQQLVNGLTLGSVYALIALGYTMVYGILKLLNFAHGEVYMMGAFAGFGVLSLFGGALAVTINVVLLIGLMLLVAMVATGFLGVAIERFAYRPLRN